MGSKREGGNFTSLVALLSEYNTISGLMSHFIQRWVVYLWKAKMCSSKSMVTLIWQFGVILQSALLFGKIKIAASVSSTTDNNAKFIPVYTKLDETLRHSTCTSFYVTMSRMRWGVRDIVTPNNVFWRNVSSSFVYIGMNFCIIVSCPGDWAEWSLFWIVSAAAGEERSLFASEK